MPIDPLTGAEAAAGGTVIVCGCGPSLHDLPTPDRHVTIGVNDVGRLFDPTYLVVVNPRHQFKDDRFRFIEQSNARALYTQLDLGRVRPPVVRFRLGRYGGTDIRDDGTLHYTQNSPYVAVCLAARMGARRIGLIGVDLTEHHFFAETGRHPLATRLSEIDAQYGRLAEALRRRGIELVNLSATSRLTSLPLERPWSATEAPALRPVPHDAATHAPGDTLRLVSYSTTPLAGVPALLARCIRETTPHAARCVWATRQYGNGVSFDGDVQWSERPGEAESLLRDADAVIVHNGKVDPRHERLFENKPVITLAHNYLWNVDARFQRRGMPAFVVGQYQATLPEFAAWTPVPNPVPLHDPVYRAGEKADVVTICYTPHGRHERYPKGHRLYWHGKGYASTLRVLDRLVATLPIRLEVTRDRQVPLQDVLAMKRRAHIVIDECVTGSYHRNSLEGLAAGCVVVNAVGLLPGVREAMHRCAPSMDVPPFEFSTLEDLERVLRALIDRGRDALVTQGIENRAWMERHWAFPQQFERFWRPAVAAAVSAVRPRVVRVPMHRVVGPRLDVAPRAMALRAVTPPSMGTSERQRRERAMDTDVSVVIPHGGTERLPLLRTTLVALRQLPGVGEIIVVEMGEQPVAKTLATRWGDTHVFLEHTGAFERARAINAGSAMATREYILWLDNDLLLPPHFIPQSVREITSRRLDYLAPYTTVRYLSEADSLAVQRGEGSPSDCRPVRTIATADMIGCIGVVSRSFLQRFGGMIEGFRGWGGEDNAWVRKAALLGRSGCTAQRNQHVYHLFHTTSGGYGDALARQVNPYYADNVALLREVCAARSGTQLLERFPARPLAAGIPSHALSTSRPLVQGTSHIAPATPPSEQPRPWPIDNMTTPDSSSVAHDLPIWIYWEGPCPDWIRACRATIEAHAPRLRFLTPRTFDQLRDRDRELDLSRLHAPHRADYIRALLLHRFGGLWLDSDCVVMHPLQPILDLAATHGFVGHRERSGLISVAFMAAQPGSRIASELYARVAKSVRSRQPLAWNAIGGDPMTAIVAEDPSGWHELPVERIQPVCWSAPGEFFAERDDDGHDRVCDERAPCYMLSHGAVNRFVRENPGANILRERSFFNYLLRRSLSGRDVGVSVHSESIFARQKEDFVRQGTESASGPGSSLEHTAELRQRLPLLLEHLGVTSLLDAPCGDYNWMRHVHLADIDYVGADIQPDVIDQNQVAFGDSRHRFVRVDALRDPLPRADAIFCRDMLVHLSFDDIRLALRSFRASGAAYLLTTTFTGARPNVDIPTGGWRTLNFTAAPFSFPPPLHLINEKCSEGRGAFADKSIGVWRLADLPV